MKKRLAILISIVALGSALIVPTSVNAETIRVGIDDIPDKTYNLGDTYKYSDFICSDIISITRTSDATVLGLKDGSTYSLPVDCIDAIFYDIEENEPQLYNTGHMVAYVINLKSYPMEENEKRYYAELPNGDILTNISPLSTVQAVYNLDNEYIGYQLKRDGESDFINQFNNVSYTIGDSDVEIGDSNNLYDEPTNIRGDVNYDGKVNVIDVMTLRRYLLHLLEW